MQEHQTKQHYLQLESLPYREYLQNRFHGLHFSKSIRQFYLAFISIFHGYESLAKREK